jgi:signal peptidase I
MEKIGVNLKKFWKFLQKDSWPSFAVTLLIAFIIIKFIFFPGLSLITGTGLPLVIVESCSMYHHEPGFENTFENSIYKENNLSIEDTVNWDFQNGFSKGDIIFVIGAKNVEVGDVVIFNSGNPRITHPIIHRVIKNDESYGTKGDNYKSNTVQSPYEKAIHEDQLVGKALFKVPFIGWTKLIFFEPGRDPQDRGPCN